MDQFESKKVAISFPSLRIESIVSHLAEEVKRVRKTGFTIAPEAGTDRLRRVINKELDEKILFQGLTDLFSKGWKNIKLYFMIGLPTEREEDLRGILDLSGKISSLGERQKIRPNISVSISTLVPKPHTPFQWGSQIPLEEIKEKLRFLRDGLKRNHLHFKWQDPHLSFLEGIFSKGDQDLSQVLVEANRLGCRFDGWSDQFNYSLWEEAFDRVGWKKRSHGPKMTAEETFPWSFIETGVEPAFLWKEFQKGLKEEFSPPCVKEDCHRCGICDGETIHVRESHLNEIASREETERRVNPKRGIRKKVRLTFTKKGEVRFVSHLELAHLFYRASRRADLPLGYSEGFHPMPRIIFAGALPVGVESLTEVVDLELEGRISPLEVMERLNAMLPQGIKIIESEEVSLSSPPSSLLQRSTYWIPLDHLPSREETSTKIKKALERKEYYIHQERKGKKRIVDVRPLIERMDVKENGIRSEGGSRWGVELVLRNEQGRRAKPSEIIGTILGLEGEPLVQCRIVKIE